VHYFQELMQLLHPFMPFITEEVYHALKERKEGDDLTIKRMKTINRYNKMIVEQGHSLKTLLTDIRNSRVRDQLKPKDLIKKLWLEGEEYSFTKSVEEIIKKQLNAEEVYMQQGTQGLAGGYSPPTGPAWP